MVILLKNLHNQNTYDEYQGSYDQILDEIYKLYEDSSKNFNSSPVKNLTNMHTLNVIEREVAIFNPSVDKKLKFAGSDQATTCCILILRENNSGLTLLTHLDSEYDFQIFQCLDLFASKMKKELINFDIIDAYLCGGFEDDRNLSKRIAQIILTTLHQSELKICIKLASICKLNNQLDQLRGFNKPINYAIGIELHTGLVFPVNFTEMPLCADIRNLYPFTSDTELMEIYDYNTSRFFVKPFDYYFQNANLIQKAPEDWIRKNMSTSPLAEKPEFVDHVRNSMKFVVENPDCEEYFKNQEIAFQLNDSGNWLPI